MDRRKRRRVTVSVIAVLLIAALAVTGFFLCMGKQAERIPEMSAEECIRHTLGGNKEGRMAVALLKDGDVTYKLYGED